MKIFYDGTNIQDHSGPEIQGFTTNISFMRQAGISDYNSFIRNCLNYTSSRPISFQLYHDNDTEIENTAKKICSYDDSIYVKIPVIKTDGSYNSKIIKSLHEQRLQINVTAIFTKEQIDSLEQCFRSDTKVIISIFAGRMNDCGVDSSFLVKYAKDKFSKYNNIEILWAACRTIYNILEAETQGADIVTVPDIVLSKLHRLKDSCEEAGLKAVRDFQKDGVEGQILFE